MKRSHFTRIAVLGPALAIGATFAATVVVSKSAAIERPTMDHGAPHPTLLARGPFLDQVSTLIRVKPDGEPVQIMNVLDASEIVLLRILIEPGVTAPWHAHWGPGLIVNAGPGTLRTVSSHDCLVRELPPGSAIIDQGGDHLHAARNDSNQDVVLYVTFLGVPPGQSPVVPAPPPPGCNPF
jgi:quercetin dioxygenase-like cupin family protein